MLLSLQTPAERVRAKMKVMLEKSTAVLLRNKEKEEEGEGASLYIPTPSQREMIEAEGFETAKFVSHRGKVCIVILGCVCVCHGGLVVLGLYVGSEINPSWGCLIILALYMRTYVVSEYSSSNQLPVNWNFLWCKFAGILESHWLSTGF